MHINAPSSDTAYPNIQQHLHDHSPSKRTCHFHTDSYHFSRLKHIKTSTSNLLLSLKPQKPNPSDILVHITINLTTYKKNTSKVSPFSPIRRSVRLAFRGSTSNAIILVFGGGFGSHLSKLSQTSDKHEVDLVELKMFLKRFLECMEGDHPLVSYYSRTRSAAWKKQLAFWSTLRSKHGDVAMHLDAQNTVLQTTEVENRVLNVDMCRLWIGRQNPDQMMEYHESLVIFPIPTSI